MQLLECVPNLSEGKDQNIIRQLAEAVQSVEEVKLLHIDSGEAANRTVFTFLGPPEAVLESAFRLYKASTELIDMSVQTGMHPRQAAVDVCPFIPISGINMTEAIALSKSFAERVGTELKIPVYLYEESASQENRKNLAILRKGEYEALPQKFDTLPPDFGDADNWRKSGVTTIGARKMLVAYNINLDTKDVSIAKNIAELVRESGKVVTDRYGKRERIPGRFRSVKGLGWYIKDFDCVQVSYNLTDLDKAGMLDVFLATKEEAENLRCSVTGSELVGLASIKELTKAGNYFNGGIPSTEKDLIKSAVQSMGLDQFSPFKAKEKLIEYLLIPS